MNEPKTPRSLAELAKVLRDAPAGTVANEEAEVSFVMLGTSFRDEIATAMEVAAGVIPPVTAPRMSTGAALFVGLMQYLESHAGCVAAFRQEAPIEDHVRFVYEWDEASNRPDLTQHLPLLVVRKPDAGDDVCSYLVNLHIIQKPEADSEAQARQYAVMSALETFPGNLPDGQTASFDRVEAVTRAREIGDITVQYTVLPF